MTRLGEHPPAGARVAGRYTIIEPIGAGSMGAVYRATDDAGGEVALKRLLDPAQAARFEIEGRLLSRLRHPRVVGVRGPVVDGRERWLAMDLVPGPDLARLARERGAPGLPMDEVLEWAREACEALDYVHAQQVIHRDVKPSNLILGLDGVVLVDFGIARTLDALDPQTRGMGTPHYMAPEVAAGERASPRSDLYSLAATITALLTGAAPEAGEPPPAEIGVLAEALDPRPERRPSSAAAFAAALGAPLDATLAVDGLAVSAGATGLLDAVVRATASAFDAAAVSIATRDRLTGDLTYRAAWGAGADDIVGVRIPAGTGLAGAVAESGDAEAVPVVRTDPRFAHLVAERTGYVPHTMVLAAIRDGGAVAGVLSVLDRRDGEPYGEGDLARAAVFADLAAAALSRA